MNQFDMLIQAPTAADFFFIVCNTTHIDLSYQPENESKSPIIRKKLRATGQSLHGYGFEFKIDQLLTHYHSGGQNFGSETTHIFTLYQDGTLTWWMLGQPLRTGLLDIQAGLMALRHALEPDGLCLTCVDPSATSLREC